MFDDSVPEPKREPIRTSLLEYETNSCLKFVEIDQVGFQFCSDFFS